MSSTTIRTAADSEWAGLRLRDWFLIPMLGLLTIGFILAVAELIALRMFPDPSGAKWTRLGDCLVANDPVTGIRGIPNTVCRAGVWESGPVEYKFNGCGHRNPTECGAKPEGTYRIVVLGTSTALGWGVPEEKTFSALLPGHLARDTGRRVDVYNEAMMYQSPLGIVRRFDEVLAAKPDLILWTFPPTQPLNASAALPENGEPQNDDVNGPRGLLPTIVYNVQTAFATRTPISALRELWAQFRTCRIQFMLEHFLYQSQTEYLKVYLRGSESDFLRVQASTDLEKALPVYESCVAELARKSRAAGVPLVVVMLPFRAQAAMISMGHWPAGYDPYRLDNELRPIIERHGATYISILGGYRTIPNPERDYFPVDGHPNARGHAILANLLAKGITNGAIPALNAVASPQTGGERE